MSSADELFKTSTIAGKGILDETFPDIVKKIITNPNTIIVREGTHVSYDVKKEGYLGTEGSLTAKEFVHDINVKLKKYVTLTIQVIPADASVTLTAQDGIYVSDRIIKVPEGTYVSYVLRKVGYNIKRGSIKVTADTVLPISMSDNTFTFTVNPTPYDADVILIAQRPRSEQTGNSIMVAGRDSESPTSTIKYTVSKDGYETVSKTLEYISADTTIDVVIKKFYQLNIVVTNPLDAAITIVSAGINNDWEPNKFYDEHALVLYNEKYYNAIRKHTSESSFDPSAWVEVGSSIWVVDGTNVAYKIKRVGFKDIDSNVIVRNNQTISISMESTGSFCIENIECIPETQRGSLISDDPTENLLCLENNTSVAFQSEFASDNLG